LGVLILSVVLSTSFTLTDPSGKIMQHFSIDTFDDKRAFIRCVETGEKAYVFSSDPTRTPNFLCLAKPSTFRKESNRKIVLGSVGFKDIKLCRKFISPPVRPGFCSTFSISSISRSQS
jgi:hypothetical protein